MARKKEAVPLPDVKKETILKKLSDYLNSHPKLTVSITCLLLLLAVFATNSYLFGKVRGDKGVSEIDSTDFSRELDTLVNKYKDNVKVHSYALYKLANKYYEEASFDKTENKFEKALKAYNDFLALYGDHKYAPYAEKARASLKKDMEFINNERKVRLKIHQLFTHFELEKEIIKKLRDDEKFKNDPKIKIDPEKLEHPIIRFETTNGQILRFELFEDEYPNTTANLMELSKSGYFDGCDFKKIKDEYIEVGERQKDPKKHTISFESNYREPLKGYIVMIKKEGKEENIGAQFRLLLKDVPDLAGKVTVVGRVLDLASVERFQDSPIKKATIDKSRKHEYKANVIEPPKEPPKDPPK